MYILVCMKFSKKKAAGDEETSEETQVKKKRSWGSKKKTTPEQETTNGTVTAGGFTFTEEEARAYQAAAQDPKLKGRYELLDVHAGSKDAKKVTTRRNIILSIGGLGFAVLVLRACAAGRTPAPVVGEGMSNDEAAARAYAAKFTRDWFTFDEASENREERKNRLALYNPSFANNEGWDGKGVQRVTSSWAVTSRKVEDDVWEVTTCNITEQQIQPIYAAVRVYTKDAASTILSYPNLVAAPEVPVTGKRNANRSTLTDSAVESEIARRLEVFLRAWAAGDTSTLESVCVSGFKVNPIVSGQTYSALIRTEYYAPGSQDDAAGTIVWAVATVQWATEGGATIQSTYELTFTPENGKWLISNMDVAPLFEKAVVTGTGTTGG